MARVVEVIWVKSEPEYFCKGDWTTQIRLIAFNKSIWPGREPSTRRTDGLPQIRDAPVATKSGSAAK
jgi:hypothetical protein